MATATYDKQPVTISAGALVLLCALLWGGQSVAMKIALAEIPTYQMLFSRTLLSLVVIFAWAALVRESLKIDRAQLTMIGINATFLFVQMGLFAVGTGWTSSVHSIVIINSFPIYTALFCHLFLSGFGLTRWTVAGQFLSFAAVVFVFSDRLLDYEATAGSLDAGIHAAKPADLAGDLLIVAAAVTMGAKITYLKSIFGRIRPVQVVFWEAIFTVPVFLTVCMSLEQVQWSISPRALGAIVYQGVAVSGMAFVIWITLLSRHAPNDLTVYRLSTPLFGLVLGASILEEPLTGNLLAGVVLLACGIWLVNRDHL